MRGQAVTHDKPLFVVGAPRSGTSLLYRTLCLHPNASYINQYVRRVPSIPAFSALNRISRARPRLQDQTWFTDEGNAYVYGQRRRLKQRFAPQPVEGEPFFARSGLRQAVAPTELQGWDPGPLRRSTRKVVAAAGGEVFISKRISHNRRLAALAVAFPKARFLHVIRDGRAAAKSLLNVDWWPSCDIWWADTTPNDWQREGRPQWPLACDHWAHEVNEVDAGLAAIDQAQVLEVHFEDAIADMRQVMATVAEFAGLKLEQRWLTRISAGGGVDNNPGWREQLADHDLRVAEAIQKDALTRHGYPLTSTSADLP